MDRVIKIAIHQVDKRWLITLTCNNMQIRDSYTWWGREERSEGMGGGGGGVPLSKLQINEKRQKYDRDKILVKANRKL